MTEDLSVNVLPLYRTSQNERCLHVYSSLTIVRAPRHSRSGHLQALYPINGYSTVCGKKEIYADPGRSRVQVS